jgi:hypothetical protein
LPIALRALCDRETSKVLTGWLAMLAGRIDRLSADACSSLKTFEVLMAAARAILSVCPIQRPLMACSGLHLRRHAVRGN